MIYRDWYFEFNDKIDKNKYVYIYLISDDAFKVSANPRRKLKYFYNPGLFPLQLS